MGRTTNPATFTIADAIRLGKKKTTTIRIPGKAIVLPGIRKTRRGIRDLWLRSVLNGSARVVVNPE